jgi:hypothetical protein
MDLELQELLFDEALEELERNADLTNQALEITLDETGGAIEVLRYELPSGEC